MKIRHSHFGALPTRTHVAYWLAVATRTLLSSVDTQNLASLRANSRCLVQAECHTTIFNSRLRSTLAGILALAACSQMANAICTLTASGATYTIPAASHYDGTQTSNFTGVGIGDYLFEDGWWFRVSGDTQESFFPTPTTETCAAAAGTISWTDVSARGLFDATNTLALTSAAVGTGELILTMSITNLSAVNPLVISLFHGADFDVNGSAASDSATLLNANDYIRITDATTGFAEYRAFNPSANAFLVKPFNATTDVFGLLGNGTLDNFDNSGLPAGPIDVTGAFQWDLTIPASGTASVRVALNANFVATADLAITKTDGVTTATPGGSTTYTITASNAGPDSVTGATVADIFPASLTATWTCAGAGGGICTAGGSGNINDTVDLPAGGSATYTVTADIAASATGTLVNTATVSSATTDPTPGNNSAVDTDTLTPASDLSITKTDGAASVTQGGIAIYTITASNAGPSDESAVSIADTFPSACTGFTYTSTAAGGATGNTLSGIGDISDLAVNLPSGSSVTYTATCNINAAFTGTLSNTATVTSATTDPNPTNNSAMDDTTVTALPQPPTPPPVTPPSTTRTTAQCNGEPATIVGTEVGETLNGTRGRDVIVGLGGDDIINAGKGDDLICAGEGNDKVSAGKGKDSIHAGPGNDIIKGGSGNDRLDGGRGSDRLIAGSGRGDICIKDWNDNAWSGCERYVDQ